MLNIMLVGFLQRDFVNIVENEASENFHAF